MIVRILRNMAIKHKLISMSMLTCIASLLLAGVIFITYEFIQIRHDMAVNLSTQAELIADNCKAALAFEDAKDAREKLRALHVESSVVFSCIYTTEGKIFATYYRDYADVNVHPSELRETGYSYGDGLLTIFRPIVLDAETIGTVCLRSDLNPMYAILKHNISIVIAVILLASLAAYFVSSRLQGIISEPILSMAEVAKEVSEKKDYSIRIPRRSSDEVGLLIDAANEMLEQIQQRDAALVDANRQLEVKVKERTADLTATVEKLNQSNQQLQEFTYIASHDLREPVRKISSFGQLLVESLGDRLNDDERENLDFMIDGANRMQQMIEALLTYSRVTTKGVAFEEVDLNAVVEQLRNLELAVRLEETRGSILVPEPLPIIKGDPTQVRQLLQNLVANALKYQKQGTLPEVVMRGYDEDDGMVRIEVEDNGIGIKEEQYENVFVMFRRLHSRMEYEGTGIGLSVCKKIVERHNGKIGVKSVYGQGSTFWFTLPVARVLEEQSVSASGFEA